MNELQILNILEKYTVLENIKLDELPKTTTLEELGITSINFIKFIVDVEKKFNIEIFDSDLIMSNFADIDSLCKTILKYNAFKPSYKKVLICDCDDVLWNGVAGEENICVESYNKKIHTLILKIISHGGLVCLCSKNTRTNIEKAFNTLDISFSLDDIVITKTDATDKCLSILEIERELNLTLDCFVFLDNSDYEIGYINYTLPEIVTIKFSNDILILEKQLESLFPYQESIDRTKLFFEQKQREKEKHKFSTIDQYNESLDTTLLCEQASLDQLTRVSELSQRTNQFNLSNKKYTLEEIEDIYFSNTFDLFVLSAKDKFGDMGIIGAAVVEKNDVVIRDFFISCRVFGRKFEDVFLEYIKKQYVKPIIYGIMIVTEKNKKFKDFYQKHEVQLYEE